MLTINIYQTVIYGLCNVSHREKTTVLSEQVFQCTSFLKPGRDFYQLKAAEAIDQHINCNNLDQH